MNLIQLTSLDNKIITVYGTSFDPLFKLSEIMSLLNFSLYDNPTEDFDSNEKVVIDYISLSGSVQTDIFLTSLGLYRIVLMKNDDNYKRVKIWAFGIVRTILHMDQGIIWNHKQNIMLKYKPLLENLESQLETTYNDLNREINILESNYIIL